MIKTRIIQITASLFIFLFVYAAANKVLDHQKFQIQLGQSPLLTSFAAIVGWLVPAIEILIAFALSFSRFRIPGLYASLMLMSVFTLYILAITQFSDYIPCSCGGILEHMTWNQHLLFNVGFIALAVTGILCGVKEDATENIVPAK